MASDFDRPWMPLLRCPTWHHAHQTAASMHRGGVLLRTTEPPPVGAGVHLTLALPDETELVLVGDVTEIMEREGAMVRFRVAMPIVTQLETRALVEQQAPRPVVPLARGTYPTASDDADAEAGTTYSIHRRPKKR